MKCPNCKYVITPKIHVRVVPETGCWLWLGFTDKKGYGRFRSKQAHRASYREYVGEIPTGLHVLHKCDVRGCINPSHLWVGTNAENTADRQSKGRTACGVNSGKSKLKEVDVIKILQSDDDLDELAAEHGTTKQNIYSIKTGRTWKHLQESPGYRSARL